MKRRIPLRVAAPLAVVLGVVLAACNGQAVPQDTTDGTDGAAPTARLEGAAADFQTLRQTFNAALRPLVEPIEEGVSVDEEVALLRDRLELERATLEALRELEFPEEAQDEADELVANWEAVVEDIEAVIDAQGSDAYEDLWTELEERQTQRGEASRALRGALGIPEDPTPAPTGDD